MNLPHKNLIFRPNLSVVVDYIKCVVDYKYQRAFLQGLVDYKFHVVDYNKFLPFTVIPNPKPGGVSCK